MNSKYVLLGGLYFVQGMPYGLQSGLLPIYLRSVGLSFSKISLAKMLYLPWILKMLWAPLVDQYRTKQTWLVLSMSGLVLACLACATMSPETNFLPVAAMLLLMNFFASVQDIAVDGVAIGLLWQDEIGYGNTIQVVAYKLGSMLAGGGLLTLMHLLGWGVLFLLLAIIYLLAILYVWSAPELQLTLGRPSQDGQPRTRTFNPWRILQELLRVPGTLWTTGFVLLYKLGEQGTTTMFPLFLLDHGFSTQQLGFWNGVVAMVFSITGSSLGGQLMSKQRQPLSLLKALLLLRFCSLNLQTFLVFIYDDGVSLFKDVYLSVQIFKPAASFRFEPCTYGSRIPTRF
ncbi:major facilitator superfamily domain-containing protein 3 isoform X3 [Caretta caretta]|uniref:major facilitator superfamily domain-containing protein 3 isoform X3 n=1 Tax=Caretta caretta TaxID=8467 RepID=UPI003F4BBA29